MIDKRICDTVFSTKSGMSILEGVERAIKEFNMDKTFGSGIAVGFSGGADSVMLLLALEHLKAKYGYTLTAVHVNHCIRGEEALRDEKFAEDFAASLNIQFKVYRKDVPTLAREQRKGLEETAREVRYAVFDTVLAENASITSIATAHNSTDNLETLIFNLMRGTGIAGLCGISAVRGNLVRPLIFVPKSVITEALDEAGIEYMTDSTNFSVEYSRNYIRHRVLPTLTHLAALPEAAAEKVIRNLRTDSDYINGIANTFFANNIKEGKIETEKLASLHDAPLVRVISLIIKQNTNAMPEQTHMRKIISLIRRGGKFSYNLPGKVSFLNDGNYCYALDSTKQAEKTLCFDRTALKSGITIFDNIGIAIGISDSKNDISFSNVYKISIQARIASAIIKDGIYVRSKKEGDSYIYGGMTRKLKKLFSDKKIPQAKRSQVPVICDNRGIVWVPGFGIRDGANKSDSYEWITIYTKI